LSLIERISKLRYHLVFKKTCSRAEVCVELHYGLYDPKYRLVATHDFVQRSETRPYHGMQVRVLEHNDLVLYSIMHYMRHLDYYIAYWMTSTPCSWQLRSLFDLALLLHRDSERIDWAIIAARSSSLQMTWELKFFLHLFRGVFPVLAELCPEDIPATGAMLSPNDFYLSRLIERTPRELIESDLPELLHIVAAGSRFPGQELRCAWRLVPLPQADSNTIIIDETATPCPCRFGSQLVFGERPSNSSDCSAVGEFTWDHLSLWFHLRVLDDILVFAENPARPTFERDSISVMLASPGGFLGGFLRMQVLINPYIIGQDLRLQVFLFTGPSSRVITSRIEVAQAVIICGGYEITCGIPWSEFGLPPITGLRLLVNVMLTDCDDARFGTRSCLAWAARGPFQGDLRAMGQMTLVR
jgi:hypothetical protein